MEGHKVSAIISPKAKIKPVLSWHAIITQVKNVKKGEGIGYDLTYIAKSDMKIAIIPVGYWHGLLRSLSNIGEVLVGGKRCKIIGRISMCMSIIDVTHISKAKAGGAQVGDLVTLIGKQGKQELTTEEVATKAGTINYELITRINQEIKRIYK